MAHGSLNWHGPTYCGKDFCNSKHWEALLERDGFRITFRVTEADSYDLKRFRGGASLHWLKGIVVNDVDEDRIIDKPVFHLINGPWAASWEEAARGLTEKLEVELQAISAVLRTLDPTV